MLRPRLAPVHPTMVLAAALLLSCGAKTGLRVPDVDAPRDGGLDASFDAGRDGGLDVPIDGCVDLSMPLTPSRAEVLFVFDRSTSMGWSLTGPDGTGASRWSILVDALRVQLPRYDTSLDMGAILYPSEGSVCSAGATPALAPTRRGGPAVLDLVMASYPSGRTPSAEGLVSALRYFTTHPDRSRARAVVLATDGAPNCNDALDASRCPCTGGAGLPVGSCGEASLCLDDARTVAIIDDLAFVGVPTYVIGIDGDPDSALSAVLTRMAVAGGRPNPRDAARAYYPVGRAEDVATAFDLIQGSIVSCSLSFTGGLIEGRTLVVTFDGVPLPRDPDHVDGWDLSPDVDGTVVLYGATCASAQEGVHRLTLDQRCGG